MRGETVQGTLDLVSNRSGYLLHVVLQKVVQIL